MSENENIFDTTLSSVADSKQGSINPSKKKIRQDNLKELLSIYPEFTSEESLHKYYINLENDAANDKYLVDFWQEVLSNYQSNVAKSFSLNVN